MAPKIEIFAEKIPRNIWIPKKKTTFAADFSANHNKDYSVVTTKAGRPAFLLLPHQYPPRQKKPKHVSLEMKNEE